MSKKLHELVAVEKDLKTKLSKLIAETMETFSKRIEHFTGMTRIYTPLDEDDPEKFPPEVKKMVTTVGAKLQYFQNEMAKILNVLDQKERTNTKSFADIIVETNGIETTLVSNVPVIVLVQLENALEELRGKVYNHIPTYDPTKVWTKDSGNDGVYVNNEPQKTRTRKDQKPIVLYPHAEGKNGQLLPAQTQLVPVDKVVGYFDQRNETGMLSPKEKSDLLARLDTLTHAVKQARARANEQTAEESSKLGDKIFKFLSDKKE